MNTYEEEHTVEDTHTMSRRSETARLYEAEGAMPRSLPTPRKPRRDNLVVYSVLLTIVMCGLLFVLMAAALTYTDQGRVYVALYYAGLVALALIVIWWCR